MRTVPFKSVMWAIARKAGLAPATDGLDRPIAAEITEAINTAVKLAWEYFDWPELCPITPQTVTRNTVEDVGTFVSVPYLDGDGYHFMGAVLNVWDGNPLADSRVCRIPYTLSTDAVFLPQDCPDLIYVRYRLPHGVYTDEEYAAQAYPVGSVVYAPEDGECYRLLHAGPYLNPELITNHSFESDLNGWTNSGGLWTWVDGAAYFSAMPADAVEAEAGLFQTFSGLVPGQTYRVVFTFTRPSIPIGTLRISLVQDAVELHYSDHLTEGQAYTFEFVATHATAFVQVQIFPGVLEFGGPLPSTGHVQSVSCRAITTLPPGPWAGGVQNTEAWALVPFPKFLMEAVKHGGLASWKRTEGQDASALQLEAIMSEWLDHEVDLICTQQQQGKHWRR